MRRLSAVAKKWDTLVYDRTSQIQTWAEVLRGYAEKVDRIFSYYNNHYAGCAYQNAFQFKEAWGPESEARELQSADSR